VTTTDRHEIGMRTFADVMTVDPPDDDSPAIAHGLIDFVFAEIWSRPMLSRRDRRFVTLACVAAADATKPLEDHVYAALNSGDISITEMREAVLHFAVYAGWPKASRFNTVVDIQWERILRERGQEPVPAESLLPLVSASDPEQRLLGGEAAFKEITCLPVAPQLRLRGSLAAARSGDEGTPPDRGGLRRLPGHRSSHHVPRIRGA
jgi:4-carboxymuconolactone decarboxylase